MLLEYNKETKEVVGVSVLNLPFLSEDERVAAIDSLYLVDGSEDNDTLHVYDKTLIDNIWAVHIDKGSIVVMVDEDDFPTGEFIITPREKTQEEIDKENAPPPKTPEQLRIEQLENDNLTLMMAVFDLYAMISSPEAE